MDPLSVAASIVGLLAAGSKLTSLLSTVTTKWRDSPALARSIKWEVTDISTALGHIQNFIDGQARAAAAPERQNLISLDQLLTTLTGCVTTYSELDFLLGHMNSSASQDIGVFDRIRWARYEGSLASLVQRLQSHKSSLMLMLTIMQCESMEEAKSSAKELHSLLKQVLETNRDLAEKIRGLEREGSFVSKMKPESVVTREDASVVKRVTGAASDSKLQSYGVAMTVFTFEQDLQSSRV